MSGRMKDHTHGWMTFFIFLLIMQGCCDNARLSKLEKELHEKRANQKVL